MTPAGPGPVVYLTLEQYVAIAADALDVPAEDLVLIVHDGLADSALHAPQAGYGDVDLYPTLAGKAAVLCSRLVRNHPLVDGNKRAAYEAMRVFLKLNGHEFAAHPEDAAEMVRALAAREITEDDFADWVEPRLLPY